MLLSGTERREDKNLFFWSRYQDSLSVGRPRDRTPVGGEIFCTHLKMALRPTQPPVEGVPGLFPGGKAARVWH
jgi:hypothetical protein